MSKSSPAFSHIVFDLDGTISDPLVGIWRSINHALSSFGYPELGREEAAVCIGPPLDESFARISQSPSPAHIADLVARFRERYADVGYAENQLYPGVAEALEALSARGARLAAIYKASACKSNDGPAPPREHPSCFRGSGADLLWHGGCPSSSCRGTTPRAEDFMRMPSFSRVLGLLRSSGAGQAGQSPDNTLKAVRLLEARVLAACIVLSGRERVTVAL